MTWNIVKPGSVSELLLNRNCKTVFFYMVVGAMLPCCVQCDRMTGKLAI